MRLALASVLVAGFAFASPPGPDRACRADADCPSAMACVTRVCRVRCAPSAAKCPADHRCVKDDHVYVCRPINDAVGL